MLLTCPGTEDQCAALKHNVMCEALRTGAFPCIVNVWPSTVSMETSCATDKGSVRRSESPTHTLNSKSSGDGCPIILASRNRDNDEDEFCGNSEVPTTPSVETSRSDSSGFSASRKDETLCGSMQFSLSKNFSVRRPTGGLSAALKAQPGLPTVAGRADSQPPAGSGLCTAPAPAVTAPASEAPPQRPPILAAADARPPAAPSNQHRTHPGAALSRATPGGPKAPNGRSPATIAADPAAADADDGADSGSTVHGSPNDTACDWLPNFSPSLVDRLWTGHALAESCSPPLFRSSLFFPLREAASARKRSQQGRQLQAGLPVVQQQQQQQLHTSAQRRRSTVQVQEKETDVLNSAEPLVAETGGRPRLGQQPAAAHVPCMAVVAAAAAAQPAPFALGAACARRCFASGRCIGKCSSGDVKGPLGSSKDQQLAAAGATGAKVQAPTAATGCTAPPPEDHPPLPPVPAAALGKCLDLELGMPSLRIGAAADGGCSGSERCGGSSGATAAAAAATAAPPQSDAEALAAMAMLAYAEPRGHVHNGPRMPVCGSPAAADAALRPQPPAAAATSVHGQLQFQLQAQAHAQGLAAARSVIPQGGGAAGDGAAPSDLCRLRSGSSPNGVGAAAAAGGVGGGRTGASTEEGDSQPDSPLSQASTVWENPQAPGSYIVRELNRPMWFRSGHVGGGTSSRPVATGGAAIVPPDARTRWWALTGHFHEDDNVKLRQELFPYERSGGSGGRVRRRGGWLQWLLAPGL